jgi:hypothetical protein
LIDFLEDGMYLQRRHFIGSFLVAFFLGKKDVKKRQEFVAYYSVYVLDPEHFLAFFLLSWHFSSQILPFAWLVNGAFRVQTS